VPDVWPLTISCPMNDASCVVDFRLVFFPFGVSSSVVREAQSFLPSMVMVSLDTMRRLRRSLDYALEHQSFMKSRHPCRKCTPTLVIETYTGKQSERKA
jgi:hypothetical protein